MNKPERRFYSLDRSHVELREEGDGVTLVGMAPPYGSWSPLRGDFRERFLPDAFAGSEDDVIGTIEHDDRAIFGRLSAGTLTIEDRKDGAWFSAKLGSRSYENDLAESIRRGEIRGASFEFVTVDDEWEKRTAEGVELWDRTVKKARRLQVGPVARPFYDDSAVALRSLEAWQEAERITPAGATRAFLENRQRLLRRLMDLR